MRRLATPLVTVAALVGALGPLLFLEGTARLWGFRAYAAFVGIAAASAVIRRIDAASERSTDDASPRVFARPRRGSSTLQTLLQRVPGRRRRSPLEGSATIVNAATSTAGAVHHRLRPLLRTIADERLRAHHGLTVDDPRAAPLFAAPTWDLLGPDRVAPNDRLAPGLSVAEIAAVLDDLEAC